MAFVNEKPPGSYPEDWRTVDYERNAFLKRLDGLPHGGGRWFNLFWNEDVLHFGAYERLNGYIDPEDKTKGLRKLFSIFQIKIPESLEDKKVIIQELITDALSEYRSHYQYGDIAEVQVDFSKCQYQRS